MLMVPQKMENKSGNEEGKKKESRKRRKRTEGKEKEPKSFMATPLLRRADFL